MNNCHWIPNVGFGSIRIGDSIDNYMVENSFYVEDDTPDITGWVRYRCPDCQIYVDTEDSIIVSITTYDCCEYEGQNIIGLTIPELNQLIGVEADDVGAPVEHEDGDVRIPYDYTDIGLQAWTSQDKIVLVSMMHYPDE